MEIIIQKYYLIMYIGTVVESYFNGRRLIRTLVGCYNDALDENG